MMCYKDRTFCPFYNECDKGKTCGRALTPKVWKEAKIWWGNENDIPPINVYTNKPECFKKIKDGKE